MSSKSSSLLNAFGSLVLLLTLGLFGITQCSGQDISSVRTSDSLRLLLGLPQEKAAAKPASVEESDPLDELPRPLVIPASTPRKILADGLDAPPFTPNGESIDLLGQQQQHLITDFMEPMSKVSIDIRETNVRLPRDRSTELQNYVLNDWTVTNSPELAYWWAAPDIRYGQLYFENVALERYGQTCGPYTQVFASAGHLFCSVWAVPFQMWTAPAGSCDTPLGYCRPGSATGLYRQRFILWR